MMLLLIDCCIRILLYTFAFGNVSIVTADQERFDLTSVQQNRNTHVLQFG